MPPVISSAVSGKKSAPKGPARRRPAPTAPKATVADSEEQVEFALLSPAATQPEQNLPSAVELPEPVQLPGETDAQSTEANISAKSPLLTRSESQPTVEFSAQPHPSTPQEPEVTVAATGLLATEQAPLIRTNSAAVRNTQHSGVSQSQTWQEPQIAATDVSPNTRKRQRESEAAEQPGRPHKQPKRSSPRSNARMQATVNAPEPAAIVPTTETGSTQEATVAAASKTPVPPASRPKPRPKVTLKRRTKAKPNATTETETNANDGAELGSTETLTTQKRGRKKKTPNQPNQSAENGVDGEGEGDGQNENGEGDESEASNPELHEIDPNTLSMFELSHDTRHGKVSEREKKMAQIDWDDVARKRREAADKIAMGAQSAVDDGTQPTESTAVESTPAPQADAGPPAGGVQFRIVNGQIVEDESSLTIDRQAQAEAAARNDEPVEEENDLTARINRTAWINDRRREPTERLPMSSYKSDPWSEEDTDRFYDALRMFGTDFFIISKMFAPRTRKQLKHKFTREERLDPVRINKALLGEDTTPMNLEHYARESGRDVSDFTKYESYEDANNAIRESMKDKEEAMHAAMKEEAENNRQEKIQQQQRDKQKAAAERKKEERAAKRAMRRNFKGMVGAGTMGG